MIEPPPERLNVELPEHPVLSPAERLSAARARRGWKRLLRNATGVLFLVAGVAGLFLPFLQGILFLAIGLVLIAPSFRPAHRTSVWMFRRWPRLRKMVPKRFRHGDREGRD